MIFAVDFITTLKITSIWSGKISQTSQELGWRKAQRKKATIHQLTTMLSTFKNVLFPGHNHLQTTGVDDPTL